MERKREIEEYAEWLSDCLVNDGYVSCGSCSGVDPREDFKGLFMQGVEYADSHHWYPCDGDYLPEYDEVVLVTLIWEDSEEGENESDVTFSHRSDNPRVIVDENGFAKIIDGVKYGHWCRIPKFTKK